LTLLCPIDFRRLQLQNNSALGVAVSLEPYSCTLNFEIKKIVFNFGDNIHISTLITKVVANLRRSWSWNTICRMDWAFTKPRTV